MYCNSMKFTAFSLTLYQLSYQDNYNEWMVFQPLYNIKTKIVVLENKILLFYLTQDLLISLGSFWDGQSNVLCKSITDHEIVFAHLSDLLTPARRSHAFCIVHSLSIFGAWTVHDGVHGDLIITRLLLVPYSTTVSFRIHSESD